MPTHLESGEASSAPAPTPRRSGRLIDGLAAATAVIVSVASLYIAWRQSGVMERQLAASVWPSLEYETGNTDDQGNEVITLTLHNGGIGPARIRAFDLAYQGTAMKNAAELLALCCKKNPAETVHMTFGTDQVIGRMIPAGQQVVFLAMKKTKEMEPIWDRLNQARWEVKGHVCYCSALEDCWSLDFAKREPTPVRGCEAAAQQLQYD